jgi:hypothetical protein
VWKAGLSSNQQITRVQPQKGVAAMRTRVAQPRVTFNRTISPEAAALANDLQERLAMSANAVAEKAIRTLAAVVMHNEQQVAAE